MTEDNGFQLQIERYIEAPPAVVWKVWVEQLEQWWAPKPWQTEVIEMDMRAGGRMTFRMTGPAGEVSASEGVFLEVIPEQRVVFTDAFRVDWIPQNAFMLGYFTLAPEGNGTRYVAGARHWDKDAMDSHQQMGFDSGWGKVAEQLAELAEAENLKPRQ